MSCRSGGAVFVCAVEGDTDVLLSGAGTEVAQVLAALAEIDGRRCDDRDDRLDFRRKREQTGMIILGLIFLLLGAVLAIPILWTIGIVVVVVGLALMLLGRSGHQVGGRAHYW